MTRPTCECGAAGIHPYPIGGGWAYACDACKRATTDFLGDGSGYVPDDDEWDAWACTEAGDANFLTVQAARRIAAGERVS